MMNFLRSKPKQKKVQW